MVWKLPSECMGNCWKMEKKIKMRWISAVFHRCSSEWWLICLTNSYEVTFQLCYEKSSGNFIFTLAMSSNSESVKKKSTSKRKYSCESPTTEMAKVCTTLIAIIARQVADYFRLICMKHREILNILRRMIDIINWYNKRLHLLPWRK